MKKLPKKTFQILYHFFEYQTDIHRNNIAIISDIDSLTYAQLNQHANQLAHYLQHKGIGSGSRVGLFLERSLHVYIAILAILKTGAAYVPLDPAFPAERVRFIASDCGLDALFVSRKTAQVLPEIHCPIFHVDELQETLAQFPKTNLDKKISRNDLCYIIYTSGTTGKPKGVLVTHENVCNFIQGAIQVYGIKPNDRVYQGFSVAFDASVEEMWLAFATGASLLISASDAVHTGASLMEFLSLHEVTVFSTVPTLLSMLEGKIPTLRILILGGEVCPQDLVTHWSCPHLKIFNTYGPTEATIVATYHECDSAKPITIGKPLPNYEVFILDENLQPVVSGNIGEIYIGGKGVAQGYINRPELTRQKFIKNSKLSSGTLYRTGDLGCLTSENEIQFKGRSDEQIKLRGYRIELAEIENVLAENPVVKKAVVALKEITPGMPSLVAYLILKNTQEIDLDALVKTLQAHLPEYMVPSLFEIVAELPFMASGKIDRDKLFIPKMHDDQIKKNYVAPTTTIEKQLVEVWENLFKHRPISTAANFFHDLGGHSLFAARAVSELRKLPQMQDISMLDVYENPTIQELAKKISKFSATTRATAPTQGGSLAGIKYHLSVMVQAVGAYILFGLKSWELLFIILMLTFAYAKYSLFSLGFLLTLASLFIILPLVVFIIAIMSKWLLLGRVKPGKYRLWGWYYIRWWLVQRIQKTVIPLDLLIGSPLMNLYCRLMGAKIGKNCYLGTFNIKTHDLLTIGDDCSIGYNSQLLGYVVQDGWLKIGAITVGDRCYVGSRSILDINTKLGNAAVLDEMSLLPENATIANGEYYAGSPARLQKDKNINSKIATTSISNSSTLQNCTFGLLHYLGLLYVTIIYYAALIPGVILIEYFYAKGDFLKTILIAAPVGALLFFGLLCVSIILTKKIFVGKMQPGRYKLNSLFYWRYWIVERLIDTRDLEVMADSLYFPFFLRMLGAKLGQRVEMGEVPHVVPDLLTMQEESFMASWIFVGLPIVFGGYANFAPTVIGKRAFVGNAALLPAGTELGEHCLIGCLSVPPANELAKKPDTSWFGSPAVFLPRREIFEGFSDKDIYHPSIALYIKRLLIEFTRILLPSTFYFIVLIGVFFAIDFLYPKYSLLTTIILFPLVEFLIVAAVTLLAVAIKWLVMGKMHEGVKPSWCTFIWKYDVAVHLYEQFISPSIVEPLLGSPFVAFFLRLMGAKIGKRVFINTVDFAEFDLIEIKDDATLNADCIIQTHLYEDRIFKMSHIKINEGCNVGAGSIVLYNTIMEKNSSLGSLSLLMKGEILPHNTHWEGIPAQRAAKISANVTEEITELTDSGISIQPRVD